MHSETKQHRPNQNLSAMSLAYNYLLTEIRSGRLLGGTHVIAEKVALEIGVSRIPVREAIRQLASEGFMTIRSNRGPVVTMIGKDEITELYEMRAVLEGFAMRYVVTRIDTKGIEEVNLALKRLEYSRKDMEWFIPAHQQLHDILLSYCPRPRILEEIRRLRSAAEPYFRMNLKMSSTAVINTVDEHTRLIEQILSKDADVAEQGMREHVMRVNVAELTKIPLAESD